MSLRARLTAAITVLVASTLLVVWLFGSGRILQPFSAAVFAGFVKTAMYVADEVDKGADPAALGQQLGLDIRVIGEGRRPDRGQARGKGKKGRKARGRPEPGELPPHIIEGLSFSEQDGRDLAFPPGPRDRILVRTETRGWVMVRRDLDLAAPNRQFAAFLVLAGILIVLVASLVASYGVRPLSTARQAMGRIASGDLEHRLDESGPEELASVASAFNQMADRIDKMLRTERELLAGISHELRTPLSRLHLELELLGDTGSDPNRIDAMRGDLQEIDRMIGELLDLSKMQLGDTALNRALVDLNQLAHNAAGRANIPNAITIEGMGAVDGDAVLIERAIGNVLQNAGRYANGSPVTIRIEGPTVTIEDGGPGVSDEMLERLFDPFWRAEGSRARSTGGIGLGGMIVRQVTELHGGFAKASNREEGGLRVVLEFARRRAQG